MMGIGSAETIILLLISVVMYGGLAAGVLALVRVVRNTTPPPLPPGASLFPCPDCGRNVSRLATTCPQCGRPLTPARIGAQ